jgi:hypothetical protein
MLIHEGVVSATRFIELVIAVELFGLIKPSLERKVPY